MPLAASVVTAAAGAGLTWESNPLGGERSGLLVMFGDRASALPVLILVGALLLTIAAVVATMRFPRRKYARAAILGALTTLGMVGWYGIRITGERVRAIGMDSAGNLIEPEAASHLGIGWYLTATALLTTVVLAIGLTRTHSFRVRGDT
ncbi:hypothetical protein [Paractinoplanes toevensis]|uniref:Uncharacterized protein n=1 Tax=Paractinoplanes toevensis TaxID=571911 RepID=A0A919W8N4_9ACTN|nr:hypothetical protein [Actinoplanes toevensis]GIM94776.1 hypothetical protein Ato02nite_065690 [Actinoplanes toevensis]